MARTAEVKRDARIGEAEARRDAQIKEAIAEEERMAARLVVCVFNTVLIFDLIMSNKSMQSMECMYKKVSRYLAAFHVTLCCVLWYP